MFFKRHIDIIWRYIINVTVDNFSTKIYDNKNYNCKCSQFDNFVFNVYNKNKNLGLSENYDVDGRNTVMNKK